MSFDLFVMSSLEERLSTLEHAFVTNQRDIAKSVHVINENNTIMLGLLHTLAQQGKQTRLRVEGLEQRVERLETKVDVNTAMLNQHTAILNEHTARFNRLEGLLNQVLARLPQSS